MQQTVELSRKQKLKKFNEKLQFMMKSKNIDKNKLNTIISKTNNETDKQKLQQNQPKEGENSKKIEKKDIIMKKELVKEEKIQKLNQDDNVNEQQEQQINNPTDKTKKIQKKSKKQKDVTLRKAAGLVWKDKSLQQWPQNDYRIFCGNLGNQVTDQMLNNVFKMKYHSCQMTRVVKDKRTGKSQGFGFVSFKDPKDFLRALKQMNGQYIGNRPVKVTKSNWKDRELDSEKNKYLPSDFKANSGKETNKICSNFKYTSPF